MDHSRILAIDVGGGTQDIFLYEKGIPIENSVKLILPSQTRIVANRIARLTEKREAIFLTGNLMGGGACVWAVKNHLSKGLQVFATELAAKTILDNLTISLPQASEPLQRIKAAWAGPNQQQVLREQFVELPKISIDFAVMEKAENVFTIKLDCRWLDMGSFAALADIISSDKDKNIIVAGTNELLDCKNSIFVTEDAGHLIAAVGLEDIVVAHSPDATLVCHISQTDKIKELLELMDKHGRKKFL